MTTKTINKLPNVYLRNEDDLSELFCELINCSGEIPNESDPTGCTGCDAQEEFIEKHYSDVIIDEQEIIKAYFVEVEELDKYLSSVMNVRNDEKAMRLMIIDLQQKIKSKLTLEMGGN